MTGGGVVLFSTADTSLDDDDDDALELFRPLFFRDNFSCVRSAALRIMEFDRLLLLREVDAAEGVRLCVRDANDAAMAIPTACFVDEGVGVGVVLAVLSSDLIVGKRTK